VFLRLPTKQRWKKQIDRNINTCQGWASKQITETKFKYKLQLFFINNANIHITDQIVRHLYRQENQLHTQLQPQQCSSSHTFEVSLFVISAADIADTGNALVISMEVLLLLQSLLLAGTSADIAAISVTGLWKIRMANTQASGRWVQLQHVAAVLYKL